MKNQYSFTDYNGFLFPKTPVIINKEIDKIQLFKLGVDSLLGKRPFNQKNTLNARMETIKEKPAFRTSVKNRCFSSFRWVL